MRRALITLALASTLLAACGESTPPIPVTQGTAAVQQPADNGTTNALLGGALGFMAGQALANRGGAHAPAPTPVVVNRTVVVKKTVVNTTPRPSWTTSRSRSVASRRR